ncbi:M48 family metallopeptidase [Thiomicrorhabdus sp. ZW0627]|uniref:M48 family metallopeptidase n=1 Tax=Thiomicrorhabdus sp. ZW0627 TaxID=3039774 RepID=UPI0024366C72|nr:M48 family metallopeptidase [Thiomicrorhabdus sp. ZW0627]MDG6774242.1 M48 family metallopeptidase [Thiomicrorhabdus sp. ZW0627]
MKFLKSIVMGLAFLTLSACVLGTQTTKQGAVGVERQQLMMVSEQEINTGAIQAYSGILKEAREKKTLNTDPVMVKRIRTVAQRLIPQTRIYRSDAPSWNWEVNLIKSDQLNAWCMPGGKIAFYTGIIQKLNLTDDEIAAIMGHEMAHALREHGRERASQAQLTQVGLAALQAFTGFQGPSMDLAAMAINVTLTLPNSRTHETEADRMGVELAARAGYNPYAAVNVWQKMSKMNGNGTPEILSTHPAHDTRIKDLNKYAKRVEPLYLSAKRN